MLVEPLIALPQLLSAVAVGLASWKRIYAFLTAAEVVDTAYNVKSGSDIRIVNGSFQWSKKTEERADAPIDEKKKNFIHDLNISIKQGSLTAIVGNVGSGKSSILSAILGEMECVSGKVRG